MQKKLRQRLCDLSGAHTIERVELIQPLWNNYGTLSRVYLVGGSYRSVIVKHIQIPKQMAHPRGFNGTISQARKLRSYRVETHWYTHHNQRVGQDSPTPHCLESFYADGELIIVLQDLATVGFDLVLYTVTWQEMVLVFKWLAHFHALFLNDAAEGLWEEGCYWHLQTRPEELAKIQGTPLHDAAGLIDARLRNCHFQTLVHGDAKLANFVFNLIVVGWRPLTFNMLAKAAG